MTRVSGRVGSRSAAYSCQRAINAIPSSHSLSSLQVDYNSKIKNRVAAAAAAAALGAAPPPALAHSYDDQQVTTQRGVE